MSHTFFFEEETGIIIETRAIIMNIFLYIESILDVLENKVVLFKQRRTSARSSHISETSVFRILGPKR